MGGKEHGGKELREDWAASNAGAPTSHGKYSDQQAMHSISSKRGVGPTINADVTCEDVVTCEGCTRWGAVSGGRSDKALYVGVNMELGEGWTACLHEGSTSYQNHMGKEGGGASLFVPHF